MIIHMFDCLHSFFVHLLHAFTYVPVLGNLLVIINHIHMYLFSINEVHLFYLQNYVHRQYYFMIQYCIICLVKKSSLDLYREENHKLSNQCDKVTIGNIVPLGKLMNIFHISIEVGRVAEPFQNDRKGNDFLSKQQASADLFDKLCTLQSK